MKQIPGLFVAVALVMAVAACLPAEAKVQVTADAGIRRSVMTYLDQRKSVENAVRDSVRYLLVEPYDDGQGHILIFSYVLGPGSKMMENQRITVLLHLLPDGEMWGGSIGTVVLEQADPNPISLAAWTWLDHPDRGDYAFYGTIKRPGVRRIELIEQDGDLSEVEVQNGQKAFFIPRPHRDNQWATQFPEVLRAYDASGWKIFEWVRPKDWGTGSSHRFLSVSPSPAVRSDLSPSETVTRYFEMYNQRKWREAWLYLERRTGPLTEHDEDGYVQWNL